MQRSLSLVSGWIACRYKIDAARHTCAHPEARTALDSHRTLTHDAVSHTQLPPINHAHAHAMRRVATPYRLVLMNRSCPGNRVKGTSDDARSFLLPVPVVCTRSVRALYALCTRSVPCTRSVRAGPLESARPALQPAPARLSASAASSSASKHALRPSLVSRNSPSSP